jgi:glycosyltransferase involved in cell wall biosynthesis
MSSTNERTTPQADGSLAVHFFGFLRGSNGLGEAGRLIVRSLRAGGVDATIHSLPLAGRDDLPLIEDAGMVSKETLPPDGSICILCLDPNTIAHFKNLVHPEFFSGARYCVAIWFWELNVIPDSTVRASRDIDEIWVVSPFIQSAFSRALHIPVRTFRQPLDFSAIDAVEPITASAIEGRFVFLFSFAYDSYGPRKNPEAVCAAFANAFPQPSDNGPVLIIKSTKATGAWFVNHSKMVKKWCHRTDIFFIDGVMTDAARLELVRRCDCYVSLHRAEGLGLTIMEAMADGKPCIATGYSGNLSFMTSENSALIPWAPTREGLNAPPYCDLEGAEWADPDIAAAASAMTRIYHDRSYGHTLGQQARSDIRSLHGLESVGKELRDLICSCPVRTIEAKPPAASGVPIIAAFDPAGASEASIIESCHSRATRELKAIKAAMKIREAGGLIPAGVAGACDGSEPFLIRLVDVCQLALKALKEKEKSLVAIGRDLNSLFLSCPFPAGGAREEGEAAPDDPPSVVASAAYPVETFHTKAIRSLSAFKADLKQRQERRVPNGQTPSGFEDSELFLIQLADACHLALKAVKEKEDTIVVAIQEIDGRLSRLENHVSQLAPLIAVTMEAIAPTQSEWSRLGIQPPSS